jgi:hypothetical protein
MTKAALRDEQLLPALDGRRIELRLRWRRRLPGKRTRRHEGRAQKNECLHAVRAYTG